MTRRLLIGLGILVAMSGAARGGMIDEKPLPKSLYDRLGGQPAIVLVVDEFVANVADDSRINGRFASTDASRLKALLVDQVCEATGGPCRYVGRDMKSAHTGMRITDAEFDALVEDLVRALDKLSVPAPEKSDLLGLLGHLRPQVVGQ